MCVQNLAFNDLEQGHPLVAIHISSVLSRHVSSLTVQPSATISYYAVGVGVPVYDRSPSQLFFCALSSLTARYDRYASPRPEACLCRYSITGASITGRPCAVSVSLHVPLNMARYVTMQTIPRL